jgi:Phage integrase family
LPLPLLLALWTGQRQGDLLRLPWSAYEGTHIRLRQSKTGKPVPPILVVTPLKAALDSAAKRSPIILTNSEGKPLTSDGFRASWRKACAAAGVRDVTFHDLRGTAVTRLALFGATVSEIANITGHRCATCTRSSTCTTWRAIRRSAITQSGSSKEEQKLPTDRPTGLGCSCARTRDPAFDLWIAGLFFKPRAKAPIKDQKVRAGFQTGERGLLNSFLTWWQTLSSSDARSGHFFWSKRNSSS